MKRLVWWHKKQGLDGSLTGAAPAQVLARTGWARSVGSASPYFTLFSRAGATRQAADQAVADLHIHELPSARGCTHVVPAEDFALALKVAQPSADVPINQAKKYLDVTDQELDTLFQAVREALAPGEPLNPDQLKEACGGAIRNLGDAGKKRGMTTTLPLALGYLQAHGEIRRVPKGGRLDQQRYAYTRWAPNPFQTFTLTYEEALTELARRYFAWIGPATLAHFQWFSGLGVGAAKAAVAPLGLVPVEAGEPFLILPEELEQYRAFEPPTEPQPALVTNLDGLLLHRREFGSLMSAADQQRPIFTEKGIAQSVGALSDAPLYVIVDRGRIIGFWDYDEEERQIAWMTFDAPPAGLREVVERTEAYARDQLGVVRSFSLDTAASRAPRIAWLRQQHR
ncbi:MAG: hypothetical protein K0R39_4622 [Symbiobacteriaceae bacterium]|nr:hypothetical protein [Symbiobacteriaceae bacterium]